MPTKISEKNLLVGLVLLSAGLLMLFTANLTNTPVRVSENGLLAFMAAITLLAVGVRSLTNAMKKA